MTETAAAMGAGGDAERARDAMLAHMGTEVERALGAGPLKCLRIIAEIQDYGAWAARFAVDACRDAGVSWPVMATAVGVPHSSLTRQHANVGPLVIARPAGTLGDDGQTPLRQAATQVVKATFPTRTLMSSPTGALIEPVQAMAEAMRTLDRPEPLLSAVGRVLEVADGLPGRVRPGGAVDQEEAAIWDAVDELADVYARDRILIETIAAGRPAVVVVFEDAQVRVPISEGSKIHVMIDRALALHGVRGENNGAFMLLNEEGRELGMMALARDEKVRADDQLTLRRRP